LRSRLDREGLADDQRVALLGILAHDALVVRVGHVLGEDVLDLAAPLGGLERLVDARHPLLLDRDGVDGRHLELLLSQAACLNRPTATAAIARAVLAPGRSCSRV
jgi:hypothetical protein